MRLVLNDREDCGKYWNDHHDKFLTEARDQLSIMSGSRDILSCAINGTPFFGILTVVLELIFRSRVCETLSPKAKATVFDRTLRILEAAANFFLSTLSMNMDNFSYCSSFEEMSQAINESIRCSEVNEDVNECLLSPAHQLVVSVIWMSLKVICELAAEVGSLGRTEVTARRATDVVVDVLLRCRHKGAIEAAGLALATLTKSLCNGQYHKIIETHLDKLLNIDDNDTINLTRRGAGLSITFHRIVSSDHRNNRPLLQFSVNKLLDFLKKNIKDNNKIQANACLRDSSRARHLHFMRSVVADKSLQAHMVPHMEDICFVCFEYFESSEWTVRNASLQLFGAIVPRLVGQCSGRELDYGIGNSINHFVTHFPTLSANILHRLKSTAKSFHVNFHVNNDVVPILLLLSKMSTGSCDIIDYSSKSYIETTTNALRILFGHPVFHIRKLASKAFAAFIGLPSIPKVLAKMQIEDSIVTCNNYQHGQLSAQIYLKRKLKHGMHCTSDKFVFLNNFNDKYNDDYKRSLNEGISLQSDKLQNCITKLQSDDELFCYPVYSALMTCLSETSRLNLLSTIELPANITIDVDMMSKLSQKRTIPGFVEFFENSVIHLKTQECNLKQLVVEAMSIFHDYSNSDILLKIICSIRDIVLQNANYDRNTADGDILSKMRLLTDQLKNIDEASVHLHAMQLRNMGYIIAIKLTAIDDPALLDSTLCYISEKIYDSDRVVKKLSIECLSCLVKEMTTREFILDLRTQNAQKLIEFIIATLTDEDPQTREKMSKTFNPIIQRILCTNDEPMCASASLHKILYKLAILWREKGSLVSKNDCENIFRRLVNIVKIEEKTDAIKSPFQQNECLPRDESMYLDILINCVSLTTIESNFTRYHDSSFPRANRYSIEAIQIAEIIKYPHRSFSSAAGSQLLKRFFREDSISHYFIHKIDDIRNILDKRLSV